MRNARAALRARETPRFDKAARARNPAKGLVHYFGRLEKARRRGNARKIAKFGRKVQKYSKLAAAASRQLGGLFDAAADSDSDDDESFDSDASSSEEEDDAAVAAEIARLEAENARIRARLRRLAAALSSSSSSSSSGGDDDEDADFEGRRGPLAPYG